MQLANPHYLMAELYSMQLFSILNNLSSLPYTYVHSDIFADLINTDRLKDENVVGAFIYLFHKLYILLATVDIATLKSACMFRGAALPQEFKEGIDQSRSVDDIFNVLDNQLYCNWLNVRLLKQIAKNTDNQQAVDMIKIYEDSVKPRKFSDVQQYLPLCFNEKIVSQIEVKVNDKRDNLTIGQCLSAAKDQKR